MSEKQQKLINLALQGGGSHGAFTWGVLDQLLQDKRVRIEGISGTSAGAMNAVVLAEGMRRDGPEGARKALAQFWRAVSNSARFSPIQRTFLDSLTGNWNLDNSPGYLFFDLLSRVVSPYQTNPLNINPLFDLINDLIDFDEARKCDRIKLFISATNVRTGRIKIFDQSELTAETLMASACLPLLFQAVEIDGEAYWDGGYMGNPALFPMFHSCSSRDIIIVQINPIEVQKVPTTAREILNRMNEITFNGSLLRELRAIDFVDRLVAEQRLNTQRYREILLHRITSGELDQLDASSKLNAEWTFFLHLKDIGKRAALDWLDNNYQALGKHSSIDVRAMFE